MNHNPKFHEALKEYLFITTCQQPQDERETFDCIQALSLVQRRKLWTIVGKYCKVDSCVARDYYHNTWSTQFFRSVKELKPNLD